MGTGGSLLRQVDDDDVLGVEYDSSQGVVKRIPIEVKPRGKLGGLGLRSVRSLGKPKSGSLRSALSIDLEDPEVTRIRKDFEMYKLNKENEMANMQKKVQKIEMENKKLRVELQTLQKTCRKLRDERDGARDAENQAMVRAAAFENDRDKIQRQFKIFRETKESELQNLLKARRQLENRLVKLGHAITPDENAENASRLGLSIGGGNPGDWWTALESEPSLGSTTQLHTPMLRGPEFAHTMLEMEGPYINVNKEDWQNATANLSQIFPTIPDSLQTNTVSVFISAPNDVMSDVKLLQQEYVEQLRMLCAVEGRFLNVVHMPCDGDEAYPKQWTEKHITSRCRQIDKATIFLAFLAQNTNRFTEMDFNMGHFNNPGAKPVLFCFKQVKGGGGGDVLELHRRVKESGVSPNMIISYSTAAEGAQKAFTQLERCIKIELGVESNQPESLSTACELDGPEHLCGGCLWDTNNDCEQMEALVHGARSTCQLGFEQYYERLNAHVLAAGPLPPLLVCGRAGAGKSLLLAKWIELQQQRVGGGLVLYHFVGGATSCSTDPIAMIRRLTAQLMQHVSSPPALTCDPIRIVDEFPKWLEKVSAKINGGVVLVLDSADRLQDVEQQLKWLLDPLPVDSRVIVSVTTDACPAEWRSWPRVELTELSRKQIRELMSAELSSHGHSLSSEQEARILAHCRAPTTCTPLYVVVVASDLARCTSEESVGERLDMLLQTADTAALYCLMLECVEEEFDLPEGMLSQVMCLVYGSRNGVSEAEIMAMLPALSWNLWACVCDALLDRQLITYRAGLLVFAHQQARDAVEELYFAGDEGKETLKCTWLQLRDYFSLSTKPGSVTYRVSDELPWLNHQLEDKEALYNAILDLCIFVKLYGRGRCAEIIVYWQYLGVDKHSMADSYYKAMKYMETMVGQFNGLITLPRIADVYEALGRFLRDLNLLNEALMPLQRALEIRETSLDPDHPSVGQSLHQVAGLHAQQNKFSTAEALYKQALDIFEGAFGRDHVSVAKELDALAVLYQKQGKLELADPVHKRAMSIRKRARQPLRAQQGMLSHGVPTPLGKRVLQLEELTMGADSLDLAKSLNEIGVLYYLQNNMDTAESFFRRSLQMRESLLGADHPDVAQSLNNLAALYNDRKQYDRAQPLYERALAIRKQEFCADHPSVITVVKHLGMLYKKMGKLSDAIPLYQQMVEMRETSFGASHPSVATAMVNLAVLFSQQGKHSSAQPLYEKALTIYEDSLGTSHPRVAETLKNLALLKYEEGEYETAAKLYKRSTEIKDADPNGASSVPPSSKAATHRDSDDDDTVLTVRNNIT